MKDKKNCLSHLFTRVSSLPRQEKKSTQKKQSLMTSSTIPGDQSDLVEEKLSPMKPYTSNVRMGMK
jgi:hypothetical protein